MLNPMDYAREVDAISGLNLLMITVVKRMRLSTDAFSQCRIAETGHDHNDRL
jgi:hypothetical protein